MARDGTRKFKIYNVLVTFIKLFSKYKIYIHHHCKKCGNVGNEQRIKES